jgi:hypothetical protein
MEVRESFARRILKRYCLGAFYEADFFIESVKQAISERNPSDLAAELNNFLEGIPDFIYENHGLLGSKERDEAFYLKLILLAFSALSVDYKLEKLEKSGKNCFALYSENRTWLFELKVSHYKAIPKEGPFNLIFPKFETIDLLSSAIYEDELVIAESRGEDLSEDDIEKQDAISLKAIEQAERIIYGKEDISSLGPNALYSLMMLSKGSIEHIPMELREKEEPSEEAMLEGDQKLLDKAFKKMIKRHYGQQYKNPVLFAFVINDNLREITTCKYSDGFPKKR